MVMDGRQHRKYRQKLKLDHPWYSSAALASHAKLTVAEIMAGGEPPADPELFLALQGCIQQQWEQGRQIVAEILARRHQGLVMSALRRTVNSWGGDNRVDCDELHSGIQVAFLRCLQSYSPRCGYRFSTYAMFSMLREGRRVAARDRRRHERCPSTETLPEAGCVDSSEEMGGDDMETLRRVWQTNQAQLDDRERAIVALRFGLTGSPCVRTYQAIGRMFGITKERVRQIIRDALNKLRVELQRETHSNANAGNDGEATAVEQERESRCGHGGPRGQGSPDR